MSRNAVRNGDVAASGGHTPNVMRISATRDKIWPHIHDLVRRPKTSQDALEFRCYPSIRNRSGPLASRRAQPLERGSRPGSVIKLRSMLHFITDLGDAARLVPASLLLVGYLLYLRSTRA